MTYRGEEYVFVIICHSSVGGNPDSENTPFILDSRLRGNDTKKIYIEGFLRYAAASVGMTERISRFMMRSITSIHPILS